MKAGDVITENNIRIIRPALGLEPKFYDIIIGKKVKGDLKQGAPLRWEDLIT